MLPEAVTPPLSPRHRVEISESCASTFKPTPSHPHQESSYLERSSITKPKAPITNPLMPLLTPAHLGPSENQEIVFCANKLFDTPSDTKEAASPQNIFADPTRLPQRLSLFSDFDYLELHTSLLTTTH